jgi:hypothetical protein
VNSSSDYCAQKCIGQTGRTLRTIYNEQIRVIQKNGKISKYALHILNTHNYDTIENTMKRLQVEGKWKMLDTLENFYMYNITKQGLQINEISTAYIIQ